MIPINQRSQKNSALPLTYHHPFHIARTFNGLDHVTKGRIAWNAVTSRSKNEAANYGYKKMIEHDVRYERAQEHLRRLLRALGLVEPDAIELDRENFIFGDPAKVHLLTYEGEYYSVRGPLPALPSPQGRPVIIQAGQSGPGMDLAAHMPFAVQHAAHDGEHEATAANSTEDSRSSAGSHRLRHFVVGARPGRRFRGTARAMEEHYLDSIPPEAGLVELSSMYGMDFSRLRRDMRLADVAAEVKAQNVHWGSFEENTEDHRSVADRRAVRAALHDRAHSGGRRHAEADRRQA